MEQFPQTSCWQVMQVWRQSTQTEPLQDAHVVIIALLWQDCFLRQETQVGMMPDWLLFFLLAPLKSIANVLLYTVSMAPVFTVSSFSEWCILSMGWCSTSQGHGLFIFDKSYGNENFSNWVQILFGWNWTRIGVFCCQVSAAERALIRSWELFSA